MEMTDGYRATNLLAVARSPHTVATPVPPQQKSKHSQPDSVFLNKLTTWKVPLDAPDIEVTSQKTLTQDERTFPLIYPVPKSLLSLAKVLLVLSLTAILLD